MPYNLKPTKLGLLAPEEWFTYTQDQLDELTNGCGPAGWKFDLVPDTIWGLDISHACDIHDFCYFIGSTPEDKEDADLLFLQNTRRLIEEGSKFPPLKWLRKRRARTYYLAVKKFGGDAFNAA